jgi:hypothetical protein
MATTVAARGAPRPRRRSRARPDRLCPVRWAQMTTRRFPRAVPGRRSGSAGCDRCPRGATRTGREAGRRSIRSIVGLRSVFGRPSSADPFRPIGPSAAGRRKLPLPTRAGPLVRVSSRWLRAQSSPRYALRTISFLMRPAASPVRTTSPVWRTYPRWAIDSAWRAFCSTSRIVVPWALISLIV